MKGRKKKNRVGKEALQEKVKEQERRDAVKTLLISECRLLSPESPDSEDEQVSRTLPHPAVRETFSHLRKRTCHTPTPLKQR